MAGIVLFQSTTNIMKRIAKLLVQFISHTTTKKNTFAERQKARFFFRVNRNIKFSRQIYAHVAFIEGKNTSCASEEIVW